VVVSLGSLRRLLLHDHTLRSTLGALGDAEAFVSAAGAAALANGVEFDAGALRRAIGSGGGDEAPALRLEQAPPEGWLPVELGLEGKEIVVTWLWFGQHGRGEPFFEKTSEQVARLPINSLLRCATPLAALDRWNDAAAPSGFVLHMSRCGSTLVARMLAASGENVVVSEAPVLDTAIWLASRGVIPEAVVPKLAAALVRHREATGAYSAIKLDAWHTLALPLLRRVFPKAPFVFLYRDPLEVLVSHARRPGLHVLPGVLAIEGLGLAEATSVPPEEYPAFVLDRICRAALAQRSDPGLLFVDYRELPEALETRIAPHFGIAPDSAMREAAQFDAKEPLRVFVGDAAAKQSEITPRQRTIAARSLCGAYAELSAVRATRPVENALQRLTEQNAASERDQHNRRRGGPLYQ
jgi:hypothetical protein